MTNKKGGRGFWAHIHPPFVTIHALRFRSTYGLGVLLIALFIILAGTGALLAFAYEPRFRSAWDSVWEISNVYPYGGLARTVHYLAGNLFVIACALHLLRVISAAAYLGDRYRNYLYGLALFAGAFTALATGYFLPMSEVSYWALVVGTTFLEYLPWIGKTAKHLALGGHEVGDATMIRLYVLHLALLPILLVGFVSLHLWRIRKDQGLLKPEGIAPAELEKAPFKSALVRERTVFLVAALLLLLWGMACPLPMTPRAIPALSPNPVKAAWFFLALQETLSYSVFWGGIAPLFGTALFFLWAPRLVGDAAGNPIPWRRKAFFGMTVTILVAYALLTLVGVYCRGPNWSFIYPWRNIGTGAIR